MSSFFYFKLVENNEYDSTRVKRWMRNIPLLDFEIIFVPICQDNHWTLIAVDVPGCVIGYYDSMLSAPTNIAAFDHIKRYFEDYCCNEGLCVRNWTTKCMQVPQQENGNDCGAFLCAFAEALSFCDGNLLSTSFNFAQADMSAFRMRMVQSMSSKRAFWFWSCGSRRVYANRSQRAQGPCQQARG